MKKILYITTTIKDEGPGNLLGSLLSNINRQLYDPYVLTIQGGGKWERSFKQLRIPTINLGLKTPLDFLSLPPILYQIKKIKPDLIHTQLITADIFGRLAASLLGTRYVTTIHNMDDWKRSKKPLSLTAKNVDAWQLKKARGIIAVSQAVKNDTSAKQKIKPKKITVIKNAIDFKRFTPTISEQKKQTLLKNLGIPPRSLVVGTTARLARQKAPDNWLGAAKNVIKTNPHVHFVWAGTGPLYNETLNMIKENHLTTNVHLAGFRKDLPDLLQIFDIYTLVSRWEGLPLSLIEAMSVGLPAIASDVSGNPEVINDQVTGLLVPPDRPSMLSQAISQLINDPGLRNRLGLAGKDFVRNNFGLERMIREYESFYKKIFAQSKANQS